MNWKKKVLSAAVIGMCFSGLVPTPALASSVTFVNQALDLCLDSNYHDPRAGNPQQGAVYGEYCNGGNYQNWNLASVSGGVNIMDAQTGLCLDSDYNYNAYTLPCNGGSYQKWHLYYNYQQYLVIQNAVTGYILRMSGVRENIIVPESVGTDRSSNSNDLHDSWL